MKNAFLKLPFKYDENLLLKDLKHCESQQFIPHFNTSDYSGSWTSISLRSINGKTKNIASFASEKDLYQDTFLLKETDYFRKIINYFECEKESIRLLNLKPNSKIKEHTDYNLGYEDGIFRIHIPITTNENVIFQINKKVVPMKVGECWYGNFNLPHKVENNGNTDRVHLVMDCLRNDWSDALFKKCAYDFSLENLPPIYSKETKIQMIEQLKLMKTETANQLIAQLKKDLK